jgi:ketosteroid isomerase-like protein
VSQENVDLVRRCVDAYNRGDLEALRALSDPDIELDWSASRGFVAGVYRGFDEFQRFWTDYFDAFEEITSEPDSFIDTGESVVVPNVVHMRGRDGVEVSARSATLFNVRRGRIIRVCLYQETHEALDAAGLEE